MSKSMVVRGNFSMLHYLYQCTFSVNKELLLGFFLVSALSGFGQATVTRTVSGTYTIPTGVTAITVECWGGGGEGGDNSTTNDGSGGGGGGAYTKTTLIVIPGTNYNVTIGAGGSGASGTGNPGGDTWFGTGTVVTANVLASGGQGGAGPVAGAGGVGGNGGSSGSAIATGTNTVVYSGGNGGTGRDNGTGRGGPGGSSAGTGANGTSGPNPFSTTTGITAQAAPAGGGIGGDGGNNGGSQAGATGGSPGGGGGGSAENATGGGAGSAGQINITPLNPDVSNFSAVGATTLTSDGAIVTVTSTSLSSRTYTVTYSISGTNTVSSTTATMVFSGGTGTFQTADLSIAGAANVVNITGITGDGYTTVLSYLSAVFTTTAPGTCTSQASANWNVSGTWSCGHVPLATDNVIIASGFSVNLVNSQSAHDFTMEANGSLTDNSGSPVLTISGDFNLDGTINGSSLFVSLTGTDKTIDGTGNNVNTNTVTITGNKTILSSANLYLTGGISITAGSTVTNNGAITVGGNITGTGTSNSSIWTNADNSTLNIGGSSGPPIFNTSNSGILNAYAPGNTVNYYTASTLVIATPSSYNGFPTYSIENNSYPTYYNLIISGTSGSTSTTRSLASGITLAVNGDLTMSTSGTGTHFSCGVGGSLRLRGDWTNENGTNGFTESTYTITFDGASDQSVNSTATETFYNLTSQKSNTLTLNPDVTVTNTLTMTSGNISVASSKMLVLGASGAGAYGTLTRTSGTIIGKFKRFIFSATAPAAPVLFPVGTASYYRPANITFTSGITSGSVIAEFVSSFPGNSNLPQTDADFVNSNNTFRDGYWTMLGANSFALNTATFTLSLTGTNFTGFPTIDNNTRLLTGATTNWGFNGSHVAYVSGSVISRSGMTTLNSTTTSGFAFGDDTNCPTTYTTPAFSSASGSINDQNPCFSSSGSYKLSNAVATSTYYWTITPTPLSTSYIGTGAVGGTDEISVNWNSTPTSGGSVTVYEKDNIGCSGPNSSLTVNVQPIAPSTPSGTIEVPENNVALTSADLKTLQNYTTTLQSYYTGYTWTVIGGKIVHGNGLTETSSITYAAKTTGSGTLSVTSGTTAVTGSSTSFLSLNVGQQLLNSSDVVIGTIKSIASNTSLTLTSNATTTYTNVAYQHSGNSIAVRWDGAGTGTVSVQGINSCGTSTSSTALSVNIYNLIYTLSSGGTWNNASQAIWSCNCVPTSLDNVLIKSGHTITIGTGTGVTVKNLIIAGTLNTGGSGRTLTVTGDLTFISGTLGGSTAAVYLEAGTTTNQAIDGTGTISNSVGLNINSSRTILSTANITKASGTVALGTGVTITNNGTVTLGGSVTGTDATSVWTNASNSTFNFGGANLLSTGTLNASASGNVVNYNGTGGQTIASPSSNQYTNLYFNNTTATGIASPSASATLNVSGNWINNGAVAVSGFTGFNPNSGTIIFNGTSTISGSATTSFNHLTTSGTLTAPSGTINVAGNFTNNGIFTHSNGTVNFSGTTQSIAGSNSTTFYNLILANSGTKTLSKALL